MTKWLLKLFIFTLLSLLCEMERHYLSQNIDMRGLFARRGEDFVGLLRVCASVLAHQSVTSQTVSLTRELQELISRLESNVVHFQARKYHAGRRQSYIVSKLHLRNSAEWKTIEGVPTSKTTQNTADGMDSEN